MTPVHGKAGEFGSHEHPEASCAVVGILAPTNSPIDSTIYLPLGIHLLIGSVAERAEDETARCHNTSLLFGPDGALLSSYRKMHLFDVDIPGGVRFSESDTVTGFLIEFL